jgi:glycosyltransferase involved in cell wall biosynthesis
VDTRRPAVLADAIQAVLTNPALQDEMRAKGLAQAASFSWGQAARRTLEVYRTLT